MSLVIDSSMTLAWYFEDEKTDASLAILDRVVTEGAVVPSLWRLEGVSGLQTAVRRKRITLADRNASLEDHRPCDFYRPSDGPSRMGSNAGAF